ncbi:hypothetical protein DBT_1002 [Dissulfuribacter thermophilus]|uniref:Uncharacterized protein n=1 Tax=Dissulfuribacter thermophilus TaxID=1156395 RepID=A0A1B9F7B3_9BACT|nr:hypothetical protein DBT_1002 [Dissulfuribacter thermophilus]
MDWKGLFENPVIDRFSSDTQVFCAIDHLNPLCLGIHNVSPPMQVRPDTPKSGKVI